MEARKLGIPWPPGIAPAAEDKVDHLIRIWEVVKLGPDRGLRSYLGEHPDAHYRDLARRDHQRAIARQPRRLHPVDALIEERLRANANSTWKEIQRDIEGSDSGLAEEVNKDRGSRIRKKLKLSDSH